MDPEDEMTVMNVKIAEEEEAIQRGLSPILSDESTNIELENGVFMAGAILVQSTTTPESSKTPTTNKKNKKSKINEDIFNILMILILYILQGR